jgi:hypothetical protein
MNNILLLARIFLAQFWWAIRQLELQITANNAAH